MLYIMGDLHLTHGSYKPMDIFGGIWIDYEKKIDKNWKDLIKDNDNVIIAGDFSWGINISESINDFKYLESLKGNKIMVKGNHDYYWDTITKIKRELDKNNLKSFSFIYNSCEVVKEKLNRGPKEVTKFFLICATRGWNFTKNEEEFKNMKREVGRLKLSLLDSKKKEEELRKKYSKEIQEGSVEIERICVMHYPPFMPKEVLCELEKLPDFDILDYSYIENVKKYNIKRFFYAHLHGEALKNAINRSIDGIEYKLVSADFLNFKPLKIE